MRTGLILLLGAAAWTLPAQTPPPRLTLAEAEERAVRNHPRVASAELLTRAAAAAVTQVESAFRPTLAGQITGTGADQGSAIAAGQLPTSALSNRLAAGVTLSQLITDFGRTANLAEAARLRMAAQDRATGFNRAQVRLQVDLAYFNALGAQAVLEVAKATLAARQVTLRQVRGLAESELKSTLDLSFAEVAVSDAELALYQAENAARASQTLLNAAMGEEGDTVYVLEEQALADPPAADANGLVREAMESRPDLAALQLTQRAAAKTAEAEARLRYPTLQLIGVAGVIPLHQSGLTDRYGAVGVNVTIPFLNGGLFKARQSEAALRAQAADKDTRDRAVQVAAEVRVAWLEAGTAYRRLDVTARMVTQAEQALRLATSRYELGLGGILEVTQAQLAQTGAQIGAASAKYEYLRRVANLRYAEGAMQ